jgi:hypothetical protein
MMRNTHGARDHHPRLDALDIRPLSHTWQTKTIGQTTQRMSQKNPWKELLHQEACTLSQPPNQQTSSRNTDYAQDRQFENYDDWFCEDHDAYDVDRDDNADNIDNRDDNAYDSDDEQVFRLGD